MHMVYLWLKKVNFFVLADNKRLPLAKRSKICAGISVRIFLKQSMSWKSQIGSFLSSEIIQMDPPFGENKIMFFYIILVPTVHTHFMVLASVISFYIFGVSFAWVAEQFVE
jgi:hypothetical protein